MDFVFVVSTCNRYEGGYKIYKICTDIDIARKHVDQIQNKYDYETFKSIGDQIWEGDYNTIIQIRKYEVERNWNSVI